MRDTQNNLFIFLIANNGITQSEDGSIVVNTHTPLGEKIIGSLVKGQATTNMTQARFFKTRKEKWEYLKKRNPALEILEKELM